jgi:hypothetical protein
MEIILSWVGGYLGVPAWTRAFPLVNAIIFPVYEEITLEHLSDNSIGS